MRKILLRIVLFLILLPAAIGTAALTFVVSHYHDTAEIADADCVVAFGAAVWPGDTPSHALRDRTLAAAALAATMPRPCLVLSGGPSREVGRAHEVDVMHRLATDAGILPDAIITDHAGLTTRATIANLAPERRYVLVSNDFHLGRIALLASRHGLRARTHAAPYATAGRYGEEPYLLMRETVATAWYGLWLDTIFATRPVSQGGL